MGYETPSDVMDEVAEMTPRYAGISHARIGRDGLQWPVAPDGTDTPILYEERFETGDGLGHFAATRTSPRATPPTTSSRTSWSPAGGWSTTTPGP